MYSFNVFEKAGIEPRANAIAYGIGANLLPASSITEYEEYMITNKGAEGSADLLIFEGASEDAVKVLAEADYVDDGMGRDTLRYAVLASLDSKGQKLLDDIEGIYADFDYPSNMEPIFYYMPSEGDSSIDNLTKHYREFLISEKARLDL